MTRKDYVLIAAALARTRPIEAAYAAHIDLSVYRAQSVQWTLDRDSIAVALSDDNAAFDPDRFVKATEA